jgi:hypothetical protein
MPDPADATPPNNIPTMVIRPDSKPDQKPPAKLSYDDMVGRWTARGYPKPAAQGIADNMMRESGGDPTQIGDSGTSRGLFQEHATRKADLEAAAKKAGKSPDDPDLQIDFADQELKTKFPTLYKQLMAGTDRGAAEDSFKRVFERPASIMWANNPNLSSDKYRYSDYAMKEHDGRKNTDLVYMAPQDYLDLSPELDGKPFESPSGRALKRSVDRGDEIEAVPTLDMQVDGTTGTVTDQDGRHRALLAQQHGIDAIPVAIKQTGKGTPTEIVGASGTVLPHDFTKAADVPKPQPRQGNQQQDGVSAEPIPLQAPEQAPQPAAQPDQRSLLGRIGDAIIPSAEAAEPANPYAGLAEQEQELPAQQTGGATANPYAGLAEPEPVAQPDGMLMSALKGAGAGFGKTVLAGQELVGKGLEAVGANGPGQWLVNDARKGVGNLNQEIAADQAAHPIATGIGDVAGSMAIPGGVAGRVGGNALRAAAVGGGLSGLLQPGQGDGNYWTDKALETAGGAAAGAVAGKVGNALATAVAPTLRATVGTLMREGVELTPGQMAGGAMKRAEDAMASIPLLGSAIRAAQRRSVQTFNQAAINRSLDDIGTKLPQGTVSGHDAIDYAQRAFTNAYDRVIPRMTGTLDHGLQADLVDVMHRAQAENLPREYQDQLRHIISNEIAGRFSPAGHINGVDAQKIGTQLDALMKPMRIAPDPYVQHLGRFVKDVDTAWDAMMARNNPALQAAKDQIDAGYSKFKIVQQASRAAGAHPDGTFTPAQLSRAVLARDRSKDKAAFARGDALMQDLASAARDVLPQTVPDSGTPERALLMGLVGGAAHFEPHTAAALGASALPYTAPASRVTNALINRLAQTPGPTRNALAEILRRAGTVAAPAAGSLVAGHIPSMVIHPGENQ